jgi:hypothetical protein
MEEKRCSRCKQLKPLDQFHNFKKGIHSFCNECYTVYMRLYTRRRALRKNLARKNIHVSTTHYYSVLEKQNNQCAVCKIEHDKIYVPMECVLERVGEEVFIKALVCTLCYKHLQYVQKNELAVRRVLQYIEEQQ